MLFPLSGVYTAAHDLKLEWAVIKGISDYADGTKDSTKVWKPFASMMAASLVAHVFSQPSTFEGWPRCGRGNKCSKVLLIKDGAYLPITQGMVYTAPCTS